MLPSAYPYERQALLSAWQEFVREGECRAAGLPDPAVLRSWQRCRSAGLHAGTLVPALPRDETAAFDARLQAHFDLIAIARPFMEDIYQFVGERDVVVLLADEELCILEMLGDPALRALLQGRGLEEGVRLTEEHAGTNAAALALSEGTPVQVVGPEHYCVAMHAIADTAAPIHTPTGECAVLAILTRDEHGHPHAPGIVMAAAKAIENQLQADLSLSEALQHLTELGIALEAMSKGIVFLDPERRITHVNSQAAEIMALSHRGAMGRALDSLLELPQEARVALAQGRPMAEREAILHTAGKPRPCLLSIDVLRGDSGPQGFVLIVEQTAKVRRLVHRMVGAQAHFTFDDILGQDVEMRRVLRYAQMAARDDASVLLLGESGTGKEMFAQAIHNASRQAQGPFVAVNCAALPRKLQASEIFGYEGVLIGPQQEGRPGKLELADGGSIFLDNVDALSLDVQAALVPVIDRHQVTRLGGTRIIPLDVRVIASSSNLDLAHEVQSGHFRDDLFYRLHVLTLTIPPLRERGNDILLLVAHVMDKANSRLSKAVTVSPSAMAALQSYRWPGNVRELENVLERALHLVDGDELLAEHLPREIRTAPIGDTEEPITLQEAERLAIIQAGRALRGNIGQMAEALGIGRTTLWRKMKSLKLSPDSFKG